MALFAAMPAELIRTVAGVALMTPLLGALAGAMANEKQRFAAVLTLAVTASGLTLGGVGSAFWGLACGIGALALEDALRRWRAR